MAQGCNRPYVDGEEEGEVVVMHSNTIIVLVTTIVSITLKVAIIFHLFG